MLTYEPWVLPGVSPGFYMLCLMKQVLRNAVQQSPPPFLPSGLPSPDNDAMRCDAYAIKCTEYGNSEKQEQNRETQIPIPPYVQCWSPPDVDAIRTCTKVKQDSPMPSHVMLLRLRFLFLFFFLSSSQGIINSFKPKGKTTTKKEHFTPVTRPTPVPRATSTPSSLRGARSRRGCVANV